MPKMKTKSLAKKRFTRTASGKIKAGRACRRHLLAKKSAKRKRDLRKKTYLSAGDAAKFKYILPY
jgi:large subunit ribosomal protein L35